MLIGPHIVVYDDDRVTALGFAAVLGDAGYDNIETTSSSKIALAAIEQWDPIDLLVSDIVVPNGRQISPTASSIYPCHFRHRVRRWALRAGHRMADIGEAGLPRGVYGEGE